MKDLVTGAWLAGWLNGRPWTVLLSDQKARSTSVAALEQAMLREARRVGVVVATSRINEREDPPVAPAVIVQALFKDGAIVRRAPVTVGPLKAAQAMGLKRGSDLVKETV